MKVTLDQLKKMLATYRMKVLHVHPVKHGYMVETNKGKKIVTIWENPELLKWSNGWREQLFAQGHEEVERFLPNANKKKYIRYQGKYFVLSQATEGRSPDPGNEQECSLAGEVFAKFHQALDRLDQGISLTRSSDLDESFFTEGSTAIKKVMLEIEQKAQPALMDEVIYANLPLLYKRFRRAYQLWEGVRDSVSYFPLSLAAFSLEQLTITANGWFVGGGYNRELAALHQDTVHLVREIYEKSGWSVRAIQAFFEGYEKHRKLTDNELVYILAQLAVPKDVWNHFKDYLVNPNLSDEQANQWAESIQCQRHWDELTIHFGKFVDERNEATA